MMAKINRLQKNKDINRVFRVGRGAKNKFLAIRFAPNDLGHNRFAFIVSKGVSKKAVVRNRIKRLLREAVKKEGQSAAQGQDVVFLTSAGSEGKTLEEIRFIIKELLQKIKISITPPKF